METSENMVSEPPAAEIPEGEPGQSLLALMQVQSSPGEAKAELAMLELHSAIARVLDLLNKLLLHPEPQEIGPKSLEPLAKSLTEAFGELNQRIHESEERQSTTIGSALKQWEGERETKAAEHRIEMEAMRTKSQIEINRILRVMWLGTGTAAGCAVAALYFFRS